ncbi:MAG: glycosyltransferase [Verrucomicrobia bacterium]|nr:glycosyltransferase [Verrucomicrobiota bacterium]
MSTVSTIIPTHNYAHYLGEALDSLAAQTLKPFEVIIVDDGSTDETAEVVESRRAALPNLVLIQQEQRGASAARNAGAVKARGDLLHFLDADNVLLPDFYLHMVTVLDTHPDHGAVCCQRYYRYGRSARRYAADRCWVRELPLLRAMEIDNPFDTSLTLVRCSVFDAIGGFLGAFPVVQDVELAYRLVAHGPVEISPERHVVYRLHGEGISNTDAATHLARLLEAERLAGIDRAAYGVMADTYLQYWLAVFYEQAGRPDEANDRLARLFEASLEHPAGRLLHVRLLLAREDLDAANAEAEALYARLPDTGLVAALLATVREAGGQTEDAVRLLRRAIEMELDDVDRERHRLDLAGVLTRLGDTTGAAALFGEVLDEAEAPDVRPRALAGLVLLRIMAGDAPGADTLLDAEPDEAMALRARYNVASELERAGYLDEAIAAFDRVAASPLVGQTGVAAGAQFHLGALLHAAGQVERARECLEACLRLSPQHRRAAGLLAELGPAPPPEAE